MRKHRKKVVHITTVHHPLDPRIYYKQCQSLAKAGYDITLIAPESEDDIPNLGVEVISIKKSKNRLFRMLGTTFQAFKMAKKIKADYYHFHDPELLLVGFLLKRKSNVVIYDIHEDYETSILQKTYIAKPLRTFIAKAYRFVEKVLTRKMEICLAEKYYAEKYPQGVCILNYPIINEKLVNREPIASEIEDKVIYTGNVTKDRGALYHAKLPKIDPLLTVYIYGKCSEALANEMFAVVSPNKDKLVIEGIEQYVPKDIIDEGYSSQCWLAGLALFPPTDHYMKKELTKFFEYMTAGIPIVCSDFPVWNEFIETYSCGITVNPYNDKEIKEALEFLRMNKDEAIQLGQNGKKAIIKKLNWTVQERHLLEWYEKMAN
ncbi:glycosyltransferase [Alkalihalobacterium bogoriense]|uniref:glycosyltransferase n=1 Tax=Alkalihalobacterium bogoriense TaxID=246272 RepID=UPI000552D67E|nr:glycosyltransferase [Alkalihalobacterium bogoriense]